MLLGYVSGKRRAFDEEQARALNKLVLNYALPAALFVSIARANRDMIFADSRLTLISLVVIVGCFLFSGSAVTNSSNEPGRKQQSVR